MKLASCLVASTIAVAMGACALEADPAGDPALGELDQGLSRPCGGSSVQGAIEGLYTSFGGRNSFLGCPTTNEIPLPIRPPDGSGTGAFNHFQNGSIYWRPFVGAFEVHGAIHAKWASIGWELGPMGWPITNETPTPDGAGRFNHFSKLASIYWHPSTGAHEVHGLIRQYWASTGWERGPLGYPTSDEIVDVVGSNVAGWHEFFQLGTVRCRADGSCNQERINFFNGCACLDLSTIDDCRGGACRSFCRITGAGQHPPGCSNTCPLWASYAQGGPIPSVCR